MNKFKVGDKVRCVNPINDLVLGKIYTVKGYQYEYLVIVDSVNGYAHFDNRFEKVLEEPKFKVGSRVWSPNYGWGEVKEQQDETFPIRVRFYCDRYIDYTHEGKVAPSSILPTLFLDEIPASNWPNPPAKLDPSTFVVDQDLEIRLAGHEGWVVRKFAMLKDGAVWVCSMGKNVKESKTLHKVVDFRLPIAPKGV